MRIYVSGGMTGWPDNNQEAFDEAERGLVKLGHRVTTPVELDRQQGTNLDGDGFNASDEEYEEFLARDLSLVNFDNFDAVAFVRGWKTSGGAGREGRRAIEHGLRLYVWDPKIGGLLRLTPAQFLANSRTERLRPEEVRDGE